MAKNSLNDWSTTPSSNTDIAGTNINTGCAPQDVGTFMRTIMAQIAYAVQGSGGTIPATWNAGQFIGPTAGVTDGSSAASGIVGEYVSATVASDSAVSLTSATFANVTSISLTAGDWDVWGTAAYNTGATGISGVSASVSTVSAAGALPTSGASFTLSAALTSGSTQALPIGTTRLSLTSTTTVYLVAQMTFSGGSGGAYGGIFARRVR